MIFEFIAALIKLQAEADMATRQKLEAELNGIESELRETRRRLECYINTYSFLEKDVHTLKNQMHNLTTHLHVAFDGAGRVTQYANPKESELNKRLNNLDIDIRQTAHELLMHKKESHSEVRHPCNHAWNYQAIVIGSCAEINCLKCGEIRSIHVDKMEARSFVDTNNSCNVY